MGPPGPASAPAEASMTRFAAACLAGLAVVTAGCAGPTLYERIGRKQAIVALVDDWLRNAAGDPRVKTRFHGVEPLRLKAMLVNQICEAAKGPCKYEGPRPADVHRGMHITDAEFDAFLDDLVVSLEKYSIGAREKQELLAMLGAMRKDIVGK
jgi:hemoglobin